MLTIGVYPHKQTHSAVAVDELGVQLATSTKPARREGFGELLGWARSLGGEHVWVIEDCRHLSGPFERFLIDHGESVVRLPPRLMADARRGVRERGKSDPIDALAVRGRRCAKGWPRSQRRGWRDRSSRSGCCRCIASAWSTLALG